MLTLYLAVHGQTEYSLQGKMEGGKDIPLSGTGVKQAERLSDELSEISFDTVVSSPMERARHTAETVLKKHSEVSFEVDDGFGERRFGEFEGRTPEQIRERFPEVYENNYLDIPDYAPPWGESLKEFDDRVSKALSQLVKRNEGKTVLLVTHKNTAKAVNRHIMGLDLSVIHRLTVPDGGYIIYRIGENDV